MAFLMPRLPALLLLPSLLLAGCSAVEAPAPVKTTPSAAPSSASAPASAPAPNLAASEGHPETSREAQVLYGKVHRFQDGLEVVLQAPQAVTRETLGMRREAVQVDYLLTNKGEGPVRLEPGTLISLEVPAGVFAGEEEGKDLAQEAFLPVGKTVRGSVLFQEEVRLQEVTRAFVEHGEETITVGHAMTIR